MLWDLNPCNPGHSIYELYIDKYKTDYIGGYQYEHFTIADNLSISEQRKAEIESQYVKGSIWYRRDILGERCIAEGLVYPLWESAIEETPDTAVEKRCLSIDYGTMNAFSCGYWEKHGDVWYRADEYYYSGREKGIQKTDEDYGRDLDDFVNRHVPNGLRIDVIIDPSAASFITLLRRKSWANVRKAKNEVLDGIRDTAVAMEKNLIKIDPKCSAWVKEVRGYTWDENAVEDMPIKVNDHAMDETRYFVRTNRIAAPKKTFRGL